MIGGRLAKLRVKVYSGHGGAEVELDGTKFKSQPNVSTDESKDKEKDKDKGKDAAGAGSEIDADEKTPLPGETGILSAEVTAKIGDKETKLPAGTVVEVIGGRVAKLRVKVYSGHAGAEAEIDGTSFKPQPGVAKDSDTKQARDDVYQEYAGKLWNDGGPKIDDVAQGIRS